MSKISVIIPVYNAEKRIKRCICSVLSQTFSDTEVLFVDDGSPDSCGKICDEYALNDSRVFSIHTTNRGASAARNIGIIFAGGEYLSFVDSDDYVNTSFLDKLLKSAIGNKSSVSMCNYRQLDLQKESDHGFSDGQTLNSDEIKKEIYDHIFRNYNTDGYFCLWNKLFRRADIIKHQILMDEEMSFGEDMLFIAECLKHIGKISFIKAPLYYYDCQEDGLFSKYRPFFVYDIMKCYRSLKNQTQPFNVIEPNCHALEAKYFYYINRHMLGIIENEKKKLREIYKVLKNRDVAEVLKTIAFLNEEEQKRYGIPPYEQRVPKLLSKGLLFFAAIYTLYSFDESFVLRRIMDNLRNIKQFINSEWKVRTLASNPGYIKVDVYVDNDE